MCKSPVFYHDEMLCKMMADPQKLDLVLLVDAANDAVTMYKQEEKQQGELEQLVCRVCVCMCVCVCVCVCVCMFIYVYVCVCVVVFIYLSVWVWLEQQPVILAIAAIIPSNPPKASSMKRGWCLS